MKFRTTIALTALMAVVVFSCKDTQKEEEQLNQQLDQIEAVEQAADSTMMEINEKAEEVEALIKELDSI